MRSYQDIIGQFKRASVGVIGDIVADIYVYGHPARLSREAPVIIGEFESETVIPGSAANALNNLAALGANVFAVGVLGDDSVGETISQVLQQAGVEVGGLLTVAGRVTPTKTRFLIGDRHTQKQQVLRLDHNVEGHLPKHSEEQVLAYIDETDSNIDAWLVSDYGYDLMTPTVIRRIKALAKTKPVIVDSRYALKSFKGVTVITPNEGEAEAAAGLRIGNEEEALRAAQKLLARLKCQAVLLTRGNEGMLLLEDTGKLTRIPIHGEKEIVDVTGAGDTVASVFTLALAAGASFVQAARLANDAAGVVVMKSGAATLSQEELLAARGGTDG